MITIPVKCPVCGAPFVPDGDGMLRDSFVQGCTCPIPSGAPLFVRVSDEPEPKPPRPFEVRAWPRLFPGPRAGGSPVYAQRLEALIESEAMAVEYFRKEWRDYKMIAANPDAFRSDASAHEFRKSFAARARRALAGIRSMRLALGLASRTAWPILSRPIE